MMPTATLLVDTTASSASEIVTDWALTLAFPCQMPLLVFSTMVLLAIQVASSFPSTTPKTLQIAAKLREYDFDFCSNELVEWIVSLQNC